MKIPENTNLCRSDWEFLIDQWIFNEKHRKMLKLSLLDGKTYEQIAELFEMSPRQVARIVSKSQSKLFRRVK